MARIPGKQSDFDNYITAVVAFLLAIPIGSMIRNGVRLGLTDTSNPPPPPPAPPLGGELAAIENLFLQWRNPAGDGLYQRHTNEQTKTKITSEAVMDYMKVFKTNFQPLLVRMSGSGNITATDRAILNIAPPRTGISTHDTNITEVPLTSYTGVGAGMIKFRTKVSTEASRCNIPKNATSVQMVYVISNDASPVVLGDVPQITSTRSIFVHGFGPANVGKYLHFALRYTNDRRPNKSGGYSGTQVVLIS